MNRNSIKPIYLILAGALLIRLIWALFTPALPTSDFAWYEGVAANVASGHGYSVDYGPTAYRPPAYPLLLSAIYAVFGRSLLAAKLANVILGVITCYLVYLVAGRIFFKGVAILAAGIAAYTPSFVLYSGLTASENLVTPLFLASLFLYLSALQSQSNTSVFFSGVMLGLATLTRPMLLFVPVVWLAWQLLQRYELRRVLTHATAFGLGITICIAPWTVRNYIALDRFIPISTNSGYNLLVSFNAASSGKFVPGALASIKALASELGWDEIQRDHAARKEALNFVRENPGRALLLAPMKVYHLFRDDVSGVIWNFTKTSRPLPRWLWWVLLFVAQGYYMAIMALALGAAVFRKSLAGFQWYGLLLMPMLYWIAFHMVFFGDDRYHLPILPLAMVFGAFTLYQLIELLRSKKKTALAAAFSPSDDKSIRNEA